MGLGSGVRIAVWLVFAAVGGMACDVGDGAGGTVRGISGELATVVAESGPRTAGANPTPAQPLPGVAEVVAELEALVVAERGAEVEYDRGDWRHWLDSDRDCQNTRAEALIVESLAAVSFATEERCRVTGGEWIGPWSGEVFTDASDVDVDHHVPLGHAHAAGGWRWEGDRKRAFANDLTNPNSLQVTDASVNRSKGKQAPDEWRPENPAGWCRYAADWISVKRQWDLTVAAAEKRALADMLTTCDDPGSWGLAGVLSK